MKSNFSIPCCRLTQENGKIESFSSPCCYKKKDNNTAYYLLPCICIPCCYFQTEKNEHTSQWDIKTVISPYWCIWNTGTRICAPWCCFYRNENAYYSPYVCKSTDDTLWHCLFCGENKDDIWCFPCFLSSVQYPCEFLSLPFCKCWIDEKTPIYLFPFFLVIKSETFSLSPINLKYKDFQCFSFICFHYKNKFLSPCYCHTSEQHYQYFPGTTVSPDLNEFILQNKYRFQQDYMIYHSFLCGSFQISNLGPVQQTMSDSEIEELFKIQELNNIVRLSIHG